MLIFDLDDTLYSEFDFVKSGLQAVAQEAAATGLIDREEALGILKEAKTTAHGFDHLASILWMADPSRALTVKDFVKVYRTHRPDIKLGPGVRSTLERLRGMGVNMGIITDGRSETQRAKIAALGLGDYILKRNILISGETGFEKVSQEPFDIMMDRNPDTGVFIFLGDNPAKDFRWPNRLGWVTVQLDARSPDANVHSQLIDVPDDYRAKYHISSFPEILDYIS